MKCSAIFIIFIIGVAACFGDVYGQTAVNDLSGIGSYDAQRSASSISRAAQAAEVADGGDSDIEKISSRALASAPAQIAPYDSDIPIPAKRVYYTTIEIVKISWPEMMSQSGDDFGSKLTIGLNKPYYRLKKDLRVIGSFDLRVDNILFGLTNSAQITLKYDLKKPPYQSSSSIKVLIDGVSFKVGIPFSSVSR